MGSEARLEPGRAPAPAPTAGRRLIFWCEQGHADLVEEIRAAAGIEVVGVGSPTATVAAELAARFGVEKSDDLRQAVFSLPHDLLVLLTLRGLVRDERRAILERAGATLTLEPVADDIADIIGVPQGVSLWLVPAMRHGRAMRLLDDLRENLGAIRSVNVMMRCRASRGSLYARLTDAVDAVERLCGPIELLDAAMSGPTSNQPESLRDMHGHVTVNARFAQNCCASLHVSDCGGTWARGVTVLAEHGCVRMTDHDFEWVDPDGKVVEQATFEHYLAPDAASSPARLIAEEIDAILDPRRPAREPYPLPSTLAVCEAARLSIRTGQGESPRKLMQLIRS